MNKNHRLALATSLLTMSSFTFACDPIITLGVLDPLSINGCGQTISTIQSVYTDPMIESAIEGEAETADEISVNGVAAASTTYVNVGSLAAEDIQVFTVPVTYGMPVSFFGGREFINLTAKFTIVDFDTGDVGYQKSNNRRSSNERGVGDTVLNAEHFLVRHGLVLRSSFLVKLPTGDADKFLGNDSIDFGLSFSATKNFKGISFTGGLSYINRGKGDSQLFEFDYGDVTSLSFGGSYRFTKRLTFSVDAIAVDIDETKNEDVRDKAIPRYKTIDLAPALTYSFNSIDLQLQYRYAVSESEHGGGISTDGGPTNTSSTTTPLDASEREDSIAFNISSEF